MAADSDVNIKTDVLVNNPKGNRVSRTVLVAGYFLCIDVVHSLIFTGISAERKTLSDLFECLNDRIRKLSVENTGLC